MKRLASMMATVTLVMLSKNAAGALRTMPPDELAEWHAVRNLPALQATPQTTNQGDSSHHDTAGTPDQPKKSQEGPLQDMSRLSLVRFVDGELVQVVRSIPAGKKGFHIKAGARLDENVLRMAVTSAGSAINPGDHAQITNLEFHDKQIVIDINGGGHGKTRLRDHIHLEIGGSPPMTTTKPETPVNANTGATLYLDFDKPLPEMTAEELEHYLSGVLDFSKRHSAAVQWVETLPADIQKAIQDKRPLVGMDHDMVLVAMGPPDRKVREQDGDGNEIEEWIYGTPPAKTTFVTFAGDKVSRVQQYPK